MPENGLIPHVVLSMSLRDSAKAEKIIDHVIGRTPLYVRELSYRGNQLNVVRLGDEVPIAPAYGFTDDRLLVSLTVPGLKGALEAPEHSLTASDNFRSTFAGMEWQRASGIEYIDLNRIAAYGYNIVENLGPGALPPEAPIDLALLPSMETVLAHVNGLGTISYNDEDGIVMQSRTVSLASAIAIVSHVLWEAPGVPPYTIMSGMQGMHGGMAPHDPWGGAYEPGEAVAAVLEPAAVAQPEPVPAAAPQGIINPVADSEREQYVEQLAELTAAIEADPETGSLYFERGLTNSRLSKFDDAVLDYEEARFLGYAEEVCAYNIACALSLSGARDEAFDWLETSFEEGFARWSTVAVDTDLDPLRADARFASLVAEFKDGAE